jgi:hypothetical protein
LRVVSRRWRATNVSGCTRFGEPRGQFIGEYRGEWRFGNLPGEVVEARVGNIPEKEATYLFTAWHPDEDRSLFVLDAENKSKSNLTRYMNHSCQPNCEVVVVKIPGDLRPSAP